MIKLDIFSDPVCPWCYIGKANLERALESHPDHPFVVEWHPFQLNPDMPAEGCDRTSYLEARLGGAQNMARIHERLESIAVEAGVSFDFNAMARIPNTLDAHRLIHWAGLEGRQSAAVSALFRANFREGRDIGDAETLADIGAAVGMERALVARLLASDADRQDILARDTHARSRGVSAVPTFIIANQHALQGAQPPHVWGQVIEDILQQIKGLAH